MRRNRNEDKSKVTIRAFTALTAILLVSCTPYVMYPGLPTVYGDARTVSANDIRESISVYERYRTTHPEERIPALPIVFVRVVSKNKLQLHYNAHAQSPDFEGYAEVERRDGKWNFERRVFDWIHP